MNNEERSFSHTRHSKTGHLGSKRGVVIHFQRNQKWEVINRGNLDLVEGEVEQVHKGNLGQHNRGNLDLVREGVKKKMSLLVVFYY